MVAYIVGPIFYLFLKEASLYIISFWLFRRHYVFSKLLLIVKGCVVAIFKKAWKDKVFIYSEALGTWHCQQ